MDKLRGVVERVIYANEEKGYSVIKINCKGYSDLVTIVGNMASVNVGTVVTVCGKWGYIIPRFSQVFDDLSTGEIDISQKDR